MCTMSTDETKRRVDSTSGEQLQLDPADTSKLNVDDLHMVLEEVHDAHSQWYGIGLQLRLASPILESIEQQYSKTEDMLREMLKQWLKQAAPVPCWEFIVEALKTKTVNQPRLAKQLSHSHGLLTRSDSNLTDRLIGQLQDAECQIDKYVQQSEKVDPSDDTLEAAVERQQLQDVAGGLRTEPERELHTQLKRLMNRIASLEKITGISELSQMVDPSDDTLEAAVERQQLQDVAGGLRTEPERELHTQLKRLMNRIASLEKITGISELSQMVPEEAETKEPDPLKDEMDRLHRHSSELKEELDSLKDEMDHLRTLNSELEEKNTLLKKEKDTLMEEMIEINVEIAKKATDVADKCADYKLLLDKVEELEDKVQKLAEENKQLKSQAMPEGTETKEPDALKDETDHLRACNSELEEELHSLKAKLVELEGKNTLLSTEKEDLQKEMQSLNKKIVDKNDEIAKRAEDVADNAKDVAKKSADYTSLQIKMQQLEDEIQKLTEENKLLKPQITPQSTGNDYHSTTMDEGLLRPFSHTHLPGLNVIGQTQIAVRDGPAQSFEWRGYGLKLFIPSQSLSSGVGECLISIQAGLSGQFTLPQQYSLVGAVYGITVTTQFAKQVSLEIEHCADCNSPDDCEALTFAIAKTSTQELPYCFEVLPGGVFTPMSSHGSIRVLNFSLLTILAKLRSRKRYCAQLFYVPIQPTDWRLYFVVTKDLEAETKKAAEMYPKRKKSYDMQFKVQFGQGQSNIQLNIPCEGKVMTPEGWNIIAPYTPRITKEEVDGFRSSTFRSSSSTPSCELHIRWDKNQNPPFLDYYTISLLGAKEPNHFFKLSLNPGCDSGSTGDAGYANGTSGRETSDLLKLCLRYPAGLQDKPELCDLMNEVAARIPGKWRQFGIELRLTPDELDGFSVTNRGDTLQCFSSVFTLWQKRMSRKPYSWLTVVESLCASAIGEDKLALELKDKLTRT